MSTFVVASLFVAVLLAYVLLWALFLGIGLRWARATEVTTRRVLFASALVFALDVVIRFLIVLCVWLRLPDPAILSLALAYLGTTVVLPLLVVAWLFNTSFLRTIQAWLPTLAASGIALGIALFVVRPYLVEAFNIPTNAMAPTILGRHWRGTCPVCGSPAYCSPLPSAPPAMEPPRMICENFHVERATDHDKEVFTGDRILTAKFLQPRRWDLVVFRYPEDPSVNYVMRLVGLPGETITIRDGHVWADGKQLTPPESIRGIEYVSDFGFTYLNVNPWGAPDNPAELANGEYFVLGDFSRQAKDSRLWERGADGRNPYAVPESHITGVVSHIYWPPSRCQVIR